MYRDVQRWFPEPEGPASYTPVVQRVKHLDLPISVYLFIFVGMPTTTDRLRPLNQNPAAVRRLRLARGLKQQELATRAGIPQGHVSGIENGKKSAGVDVLARLAEALECPVTELLAPDLREGDPSTPTAPSETGEETTVR